MPVYKQFKPSRKFGNIDSNELPEGGNEDQYRDSAPEDIQRRTEKDIAEGSWEGSTSEYEIEGGASRGFTQSGRPMTPEMGKEITVTGKAADINKLSSIIGTSGQGYGKSSAVSYDVKDITLGQIEEGIELRRQILGESTIPGGLKGIGGATIDTQAAAQVKADIKVLEKVKESTIANINKSVGFTSREGAVIDVTTERQVRAIAMETGIIRNFNDASARDLDRLSGLADYVIVGKKEGKSMAKIKDDFRYDYDFITSQNVQTGTGVSAGSVTGGIVESQGWGKGVNPSRDLNAYRAIYGTFSTKNTIESRAQNIVTQGPAFTNEGEPFRMGPGGNVGMSVKELDHVNRVFSPQVETNYQQSSGNVTSTEKVAYSIDEYEAAGRSLLGPEWKDFKTATASFDAAQKAGFQVITDTNITTGKGIEGQAINVFRPDMKDAKWQDYYGIHKAIEAEAIVRTRIVNEYKSYSEEVLGKKSSSIAGIQEYLHGTGRSKDYHLFDNFETRKAAGTSYRASNTRVTDPSLIGDDPDDPMRKKRRIPLVGGAAGLGVILKGGGGGRALTK